MLMLRGSGIISGGCMATSLSGCYSLSDPGCTDSGWCVRPRSPRSRTQGDPPPCKDKTAGVAWSVRYGDQQAPPACVACLQPIRIWRPIWGGTAARQTRPAEIGYFRCPIPGPGLSRCFLVPGNRSQSSNTHREPKYIKVHV